MSDNLIRWTRSILSSQSARRCWRAGIAFILAGLTLGLLWLMAPLVRADGSLDGIMFSSPDAQSTFSMAWGDADGDGDLDLAVGNYGQANQLYRNDGTGSFILENLGTVMSDTSSVAWGDADGDGDLDLAVGNSRQVNRLYRNDGNGSFIPENLGTVISDTSSVAWGDVDGDGDLDLAVGNYDQANQLYRNDGSGGLTAEEIGGPVRNTSGVAWGDVDGDGDLDLAVGNYGQVNQLYRNDGSGRLTAEGIGGPARNTSSVAWGDVDGDGDLDLAVGNYDQVNQLYRNDGSGSFDVEDLETGVRATRSIAWGDMDGDGDLDLAVGNPGQFSQLYRNDGSSGFSVQSLGTQRRATRSMAWGDADGDGDLDLAAGNSGQINQIYCNDGSSGFVLEDLETIMSDTSSVAWGDADGDGDLDLAVGNSGQANQLYRNDGNGSLIPENLGTIMSDTSSVAWGDADGDGDLDLAVGNYGQLNQLYRNDGSGDFTPWDLGTDTNNTFSVAWGDADGDGDLDLAVGNAGQLNRLYRNDGNGSFTPQNLGADASNTSSVAWGDWDGDGDLDLAVGNSGQVNQLYRNDGSGSFNVESLGSDAKNTFSVAWGDWDGDGHLDLAVGNRYQVNQLYHNDGSGAFIVEDMGTDKKNTRSVAWGDADGDGDLDLAVGNSGQVNQLYRNDGSGGFTPEDLGTGIDDTSSVAWGDVDGDGDLDLAVGNRGHVNQVFQNTRQGGQVLPNNAPSPRATTPYTTAGADFYSSPAVLDNPTIPIAYTLFDPEGDPVGQVAAFYSPDGGGRWYAAAATGDTVTTNLTTGRVASYAARSSLPQRIPETGTSGTVSATLVISEAYEIVDLDVWLAITHTRDSDLDVYLRSPAGTPVELFTDVGGSGDNFDYTVLSDQATTPIVSGTAPFTGTYRPEGSLADFNGEMANGTWTLVITDDEVSDSGALLAWGLRVKTPGVTHVYTWDTFASGFFGQSDNVVFRMVAHAQPSTSASTGTYHYLDSAPGPYQRPYASATTFPFRARGMQVRVYSETVASDNELAGALIYRLPQGQPAGGSLIADSAGKAFRTDQNGYLQGRGEIGVGDRLLAMLPITWTESYTLYHTSGTPTEVGLDTFSVISPGIQAIIVTAAHPLLLFNLDVSLEWDAHNDAAFMEQLQYDLLRAAEHLYDFSDGQATLGEVYVFHDAENWQTAHMRVYATNRLRPNAVLGGVISGTITDTLVPMITYEAGQIRMPATWNRYGDPGGSVGEDWPRTLAHEFGHYYLFLDDHYLGLDDNGQVISIYTCTHTAMTDPYRYSEYRDQADWLPDCADTLANHLTGRSDWATIETFYPQLTGPDARGYNDGPTLMPFNFTEITVFDLLTPTQTIPDPTFYFLTEGGQRYQPAEGTRGFLLKDDTWLLDVGEPVIDHILARGARAGDRLCVFDAANSRLGCEDIQAGDDQVVLYAFPNWHPEIVVSPVTTNSIAVTVHTADSLSLHGRIFSTDGPVTEIFDFTETASGTYTTTITSTNVLLLEGFVQIWVSEAAPRREMITDYSIGASPGWMRGHGGWMRGHGGWMRGHGGMTRSHGVPILSGDGQVTVYTPDPTLPDGEFLTIQAATGVPALPPGRVQIGQAYRIAATAGIANLNEGSISFQYLGQTVPAGMEEDITIYYWDGADWHILPTMLNTLDNFASAQIPGSGLYALLTAFRVPLYAPGWNLFSFPLRISQPVTEALVSIEGEYAIVYGYDATKSAWEAWDVYGVGVPDYVNDLEDLAFGRGYWISVSQAITMYIGATAGESTLSAFSLPPHVPATYYGQILGGIAPGETVIAWVGDNLCGQGQTLEVDGQVVYAINVMAEAGGLPGCGAAGRVITFQVSSQVMIPTVAWDDNRLWEVRLSDSAMPFQVYLPLVLKGD